LKFYSNSSPTFGYDPLFLTESRGRKVCMKKLLAPWCLSVSYLCYYFLAESRGRKA
jgi:hypothetical protein